MSRFSSCGSKVFRIRRLRRAPSGSEDVHQGRRQLAGRSSDHLRASGGARGGVGREVLHELDLQRCPLAPPLGLNSSELHCNVRKKKTQAAELKNRGTKIIGTASNMDAYHLAARFPKTWVDSPRRGRLSLRASKSCS